MRRYLCIALLVAIPAILVADESPKTIHVSCETNNFVDVSFVKAVKTKDAGYTVYLKFVNRTEKDISSLYSKVHMYEGDWQIKQTSWSESKSDGLIKRGGSAVLPWIDNVASSIDRILVEHITAK